MILGMPSRRVAAAVELGCEWAGSPSVNAIRTESNLRFECDASGSGTYGNIVSTNCLDDLGYYSVRSETVSGDNVGVGVGLYRGAWDASNSNSWVGDNSSSTDAIGAWVDAGFTYRNGIALNGFGALAATDWQFAVRKAADRWRIWIRRDNGLWSNLPVQPGSPDPTLDQNPTFEVLFTSENRLEFRASITRTGATSARFVRLHPTAATTTGTVPTGFTAAKFILP